MWQNIIDYFQKDMNNYLQAIGQHLEISLLSLLVAAIIGIPFGILSTKNKVWYRWVTTSFNTLRIVPSLAVLIMFIPIVGTGVKPALIALALLGIPPILLNTALAFNTIPEFMIETSMAMGMSKAQSFWKVKVPLAAPLMLTGIKTAMVEIIASATLAAYIGGGGVGNIIFTGLGLNRADLLLIGGVTVAILSMLANVIMLGFEKYLLRYKYINSNI
ncbi:MULTISPECIES: ABC transporter permease [Clostridium]|jgi:ABC-type proline/glycine betaine transport systems, permease component|uniref:ABC transporter permease n=2 Tax=Clostridium beijerinckii TaxID=1520 RepID=A0AAE2V1M2_CLOBE|nr:MULTISPECIES: ABC transporter permease [Clostridium]ABR35664.1 binding-protein-dependent transport systems inner membrane component [Clostridium beijerinckii NCIMB 8052]AIU01953.1 binding-protein-dependent transport systems inner membrane component [Clostridium beijerinckii ATCC 35702]AVK47569.1 glycine/betaine ABC transporter permease [Clostridium sp. MF28]MBF7809697.1 ABC transporter permease [Clostridium beijerinckii]NRT69526.1 osmoprotectant transport system permease protein [Clostridiu